MVTEKRGALGNKLLRGDNALLQLQTESCKLYIIHVYAFTKDESDEDKSQ